MNRWLAAALSTIMGWAQAPVSWAEVGPDVALPANEAVESPEFEVFPSDEPAPGAGRDAGVAIPPVIERALAIPLPKTLEPGQWLFTIEHRNRESVDKEPVHDFFGFDAGGLKIGLGLRYGVFENMDLGVSRWNGTSERYDTYQFDGRYRLTKETSFGVDSALQAGVSWFTQRNRKDASGPFAGLWLGRSAFDRIYLSAGAVYHTDSSDPLKRVTDRDDTLGILGSLHCRLLDTFYLLGEVSGPLAGYGADRPAWSAGFKWVTLRHTFAVFVANSQTYGMDGLVAGTSADPDARRLGFSVTREGF